MRSVYQYASRVVVWLGLKDATMRRAFAFAKELAELTAALNADFRRNAQTPQQAHEFQMQVRNILLGAMRSSPDDAKALDALFRKEYFERVWCIQEVAAAGDIIAKCEDVEIDFGYLLVNVPLIMGYRGLTLDTTSLRMWLAMLQMKDEVPEDRSKLTPGSLGPMLQVLMLIKNMKSTNPVDRIFAMLGCTDEGLEPILGGATTYGASKNNPTLSLVQKGAVWLANKVNSLGPDMDFGRPWALKPNYDKSVREVYRDFARYCMRRGRRVLDVLSHVQHHSDPTPTDEFPTWVPKFHEPRLATSFVLMIYLAGIYPEGPFHFAELLDNPFNQRYIVEPDILQAGGFRVDVVEAVSGIITQNTEGKISPNDIWSQLFPKLPLFPRPTANYVSGIEALDVAFLMTLLAGGVMNVAALGPAGAPDTRQEGIDYITRQAKGDVHEWLLSQPGVDPQVYPDLVADSWGATRVEGRSRYEMWATAQSLNRRVYRTRAGLLGLGPKFMKPGDMVVVLFGGKYPFILRQVGMEWLFLGETYLRDEHIMRGRAVKEVRSGQGRVQTENFRIR
jgi:hypothetical protein